MNNENFARQHCLQYNESGTIIYVKIVDPILEKNYSIRAYYQNKYPRAHKSFITRISFSEHCFHVKLHDFLIEFEIFFDDPELVILGNMLRTLYFNIHPISVPEHRCKYCGIMTTQPDSQCYRAPKKEVSITLRKIYSNAIQFVTSFELDIESKTQLVENMICIAFDLSANEASQITSYYTQYLHFVPSRMHYSDSVDEKYSCLSKTKDCILPWELWKGVVNE